MDDVGARNRDQFDRPDVIDDYASMPGLTPCEHDLFTTYVPAGATVLDLGVGTGRTTAWLSQRASRYLGIDYAPAMVAAARRLHPDAEIREGDASDLSDLADGEFDVVVFSYNGIDYVDDEARSRCLAEIHRVLVPGGTFVFSSHNPRHLLVSGAGVQGSAARRAAAVGVMTGRRLLTRVPHPVFRHGQGWVLDHVRGGLHTHMATPAHVTEELERHGFTPVARANGDQPARASWYRTPWWYYVARR